MKFISSSRIYSSVQRHCAGKLSFRSQQLLYCIHSHVSTNDDPGSLYGCNGEEYDEVVNNASEVDHHLPHLRQKNVGVPPEAAMGHGTGAVPRELVVEQSGTGSSVQNRWTSCKEEEEANRRHRDQVIELTIASL